MSLNGSGTWNLTAGQPVQSGTLITAATFNALVADIQATFNTALYKDGQQTATANQPMGTYKHTGVGDATARTQYASAGQVQDGALQYLTSVSGTNTITAGTSPTPAAYAAGQRFSFIVGTTNTGAVTLNVSALGAKSVTKKMSGGKVALVANDLIANQSAEVFYDGTDFILETARTYSQGANVASASTINLDTTTGDLIDVTGTTAITAITLAQGEQRTVRFTGILTLTNGASLVLPGGADITTAAGDFAVFRGYASGVVRCVTYSLASGLALVAPPTFTPSKTNALAGSIIATAYTQSQSLVVGAGTAIPYDNTIPQITEGDLFLTAPAFTPSNASNILRITVQFSGTENTNTSTYMTVALFQDSTANAIAAAVKDVASNPGNLPIPTMIVYYMTAGTTSATTFRVRAGLDTSNPVAMNGFNSATLYGGKLTSSITVEEIKV